MTTGSHSCTDANSRSGHLLGGCFFLSTLVIPLVSITLFALSPPGTVLLTTAVRSMLTVSCYGLIATDHGITKEFQPLAMDLAPHANHLAGMLETVSRLHVTTIRAAERKLPESGATCEPQTIIDLRGFGSQYAQQLVAW